MNIPKPPRKKRTKSKKKEKVSALKVSLFLVYSVILFLLGTAFSGGKAMFTSSPVHLSIPKEMGTLSSIDIAADAYGEYLVALFETVMTYNVEEQDQLSTLVQDLVLFRDFGEENFNEKRPQHGTAFSKAYREFMKTLSPGGAEEEEKQVNPDPENPVTDPEEPEEPEEPMDPQRMLLHPPKRPAYVNPELLKDTAIITMATGDPAARFAITLMQSLINVGTQVPNLIVLLFRGGGGSQDCRNGTVKAERGRPHQHCGGSDTLDWEIVSQKYLDAFERMGVQYIVMDGIKRNEFTSMIPGGESSFWGMAFNKLRVFEFMQFRKILWLDSDILVLKNIDHLLLEPDFTAAFTNDCSNPKYVFICFVSPYWLCNLCILLLTTLFLLPLFVNLHYNTCSGGGKMSGGMWSFTPKQEYLDLLDELINNPHPYSTENGGGWHFGDMDVG